MNVFLIGFMGAGKSTLGKLAAREWNWTFVDLDDFIESQEGERIPDIFQHRGEKAFREVETKALREVVKIQGSSRIIAAGGGTPCFGNNMEIMNEVGTTVYLRPNLEELIDRLWQQKDYRPMISAVLEEDFPAHIETLLLQREVFYQQAKHILKGDEINVNELAKLVWG